MKKQNNKLSTIIKTLIIILPCSLYFSYSPLIYLGQTSLMNLELSVPLIFLVIFNVVSLIYIILNKCKFSSFPVRKSLLLALFPFYATISILWSKSQLHGLLASGILWLIYFIVIEFIWIYKDFFKEDKFRKKFIKTFLYFSVVICIFCWIQSILDAAGVSSDTTLMCTGCTYKSFGFPHPNGFMAEPQYMGGILLAPTLLAICMFIKKKSWKTFSLSLLFSSTLFFTLSRGAIYAFCVAVLFMVVMLSIQQKSLKACLVFPIVVLSFLFTLNAQGLFAKFSKTDDTYLSGISKSINQLSLGIIDIPYDNEVEQSESEENIKQEVVENLIQEQENEQSYQDGYVPESTNGRLVLGLASFELWRSKINYSLFGVGIGGAGASIYYDFVEPNTLNRNDLKNKIIEANVDDPSLNVQSEYAEILVEFGIVGILLVLIIVAIILKMIFNNPAKIFLLSLSIAYMVAMLFCSGITNSLYIYLFVPLFGSALSYNKKNAEQ